MIVEPLRSCIAPAALTILLLDRQVMKIVPDLRILLGILWESKEEADRKEKDGLQPAKNRGSFYSRPNHQRG